MEDSVEERRIYRRGRPLPTGNTRAVETLTPKHFDNLVASINSVGQQVPVIARVLPIDPARLEVVAGACRLAAIRRINEGRSSNEQLPIIVDLRELDDEAALKIVDAENRGRSDMSMLEKARFYEQAIESYYHAEKALAEALGLDKSTVNRTLAITRLPREVFALVKNPHGISAAQASDFMSDWNKPELRDTLIDCIDDMTAKGPASAAAVFSALKKAVAQPAEADCVEIIHDGVGHGSVRRGKAGITIKLLPSADGLVLRPLVISIGNALKEIGFK